MAKQVAISKLNASTIDILNVIRQNANAEYQSLVPAVTSEHDIPKVGEIICGYPSVANQFINALINRIALVRIKSATFNNKFKELKKGYLEFGETVEEVFVGITKAQLYSAEKASAREFKRTLPDVRSAFHLMNWKVVYPITIQDEDLRQAFTSITGVTDLIGKIIEMVYTSAEYDEYLLFKYLMIKAIAHGQMFPQKIGTAIEDAGTKFRAMSNQLTFMSNKYNASAVTTTTPKEDQYIFMDSTFNAKYDVNLLAGAFNMDKAEFMGKLNLIDSWDTFDNDRFSQITAESDCIEPITDDELALMAKVKAVLIDKEWFQVYDNLTTMRETVVNSGLYWNYFYHTWKTISSSPFSNAIVFVEDTASTTLPLEITAEITEKNSSELATIFTVTVDDDDVDVTLADVNHNFVQTSDACEELVAVHKYGAYIFPPNADDVNIGVKFGNKYYQSTSKLGTTANVGDTFTLRSEDYVVNTLSALSFKNADATAITLTPTFTPATTSYTATTSSATAKITATATDNRATLVIKLGETEYESGDDITLSAGANAITVKVVGTETKTYTVTITKS